MRAGFYFFIQFLFIFTYSSTCFSQKDEKPKKYLLDKYITFTFSSDTDSLAVEKYIYTYDSKGNMTTSLANEWNKFIKKWDAYERKEYVYDSSGRNTTFTKFHFDIDSKTWVPNEQKVEISYNGKGLEAAKILSKWDRKAAKWAFSSKTESIYDNTGNKTEEIIYSWDIAGNKWANYIRQFREYDAKGNETRLQVFVWNSETNEWKFTSKHVKRFDATGKKNLEVDISYNGFTKLWGYKKDTVVAFDKSGNPAEVNTYIYDEKVNDWVLKTKDEYTYDIKGNKLSHISAGRDQSGTWVNQNKEEWTFDAGSNKTSETKSVWKNSGWIINHKFEYSFEKDPKKPIAEYNLNTKTNVLEKTWYAEYVFNQNKQLITRILWVDLDPATGKYTTKSELQYYYNAEGNNNLFRIITTDLVRNIQTSYEKTYYFYSPLK